MKRVLFIFALTAIFAISAFAGTRIIETQLPEQAQNFIDKYFSGQSVKKIEKDNEHGRVTYDVDFYSGAEVEFDADGMWKDVKVSRTKAVHPDLVPDAIERYVAANHPGRRIVEISKERRGYEVELSDGFDITLPADFKY